MRLNPSVLATLPPIPSSAIISTHPCLPFPASPGPRHPRFMIRGSFRSYYSVLTSMLCANCQSKCDLFTTVPMIPVPNQNSRTTSNHAPIQCVPGSLSFKMRLHHGLSQPHTVQLTGSLQLHDHDCKRPQIALLVPPLLICLWYHLFLSSPKPFTATLRRIPTFKYTNHRSASSGLKTPPLPPPIAYLQNSPPFEH
jgi:hypothetical protein